MKFRRIFFFLSFLLLAVALVGQGPVAAQETSPTGADVGTKAVNAEAIKALEALTPREVKALDIALARALTHYYDREFAQALPIFRELADKVETMDIMFWLGTSAAATGDAALAIEKFKKMLAIDPDLYRVRLELASAYFATERFDEAKQELETVLAAGPPPEVTANIYRMLKAVDDRSRKVTASLRVSTGYMWDDNITSGPDAGLYTFPGGTSFRPATTMAKLSDQATVASLAGNILFDPGERQGLMWNTAVSAYVKAYAEYSQFDYQVVDVSTGPWWTTRNSVFKLPVGITYSEFASDRLSYILHVDPGYEYFFNSMVSLRGTYRLRSEKYYEGSRAANYDNTTQVAELSPTLYLGNRQHMISAIFGYEDYDAETEANAYQAPKVGLSYLARFMTRTEFYLGYQWMRRDFDGRQAFPYTGLERDDERHFYTAVLSQVFWDRFNLSYAFSYTDNRSNLDLNSWDKTTHTLSVGCQF